MPFRDKEAGAAYYARYREENRAAINERARLWRLANPERSRAKSKECREKNPAQYAAAARLWRAANRVEIREKQRKWRERTGYALSAKRKAANLRAGLVVHGLTPVEYADLLAKQSGACAICGSLHPRMKNAKRLYVDHDHATDEIRGLLCFRCNSLLAAADDSPDRLIAAAGYLSRKSSGIVRGARRRLLGR